jgi:hypothetical protein
MPVLDSWPNMLWGTPGAVAFTVLLIVIRVAWIIHRTPPCENKPKSRPF